MNADDFRQLALAMDDAVEGAHMGHPDFRANGRIFASLDARDEVGTVKLSPDEQQEFMRVSPDVFVPASGAWGRQGYTRVLLGAADKRTVRGAMILAWQNAAAQPRRRPSATKPTAAASRKRRT